MANRAKPRRSGKQALRITPARKRNGIKVCPAALEPIIHFANIASDHKLPDIRFDNFRVNPGVIPLAEFLPDAVRLDLMETMTNPQRWEMTPEEWIAGWSYAQPSVDEARDFLSASALSERYALILGSRSALQAIISGESNIPVTTFLKRGRDGKGTYGGDPISDGLLEAEWDYIKRCPICGLFFYAQRSTQDAWPLRCAKALRARRKRASDKLKAELRKKSKLKNPKGIKSK